MADALRPRSKSALPSSPAKPAPPSLLTSSSSEVPSLIQLSSITQGTRIWIPTEDESDKRQPSEWIPAEVVSVAEQDSKITIRFPEDPKRKEEEISSRNVLLRNLESQDQADDLISLSELNPPCILHTLQQRYIHNKIYTFTGTILISVNPYRWFPDLYTKDVMLKYANQQLGKMPPHVYAIAEAAYRSMLFDGKSQSVLVSGESGAGKTETTKFILQFFAHVGKSATHLEEKVLQSTPILEAFGNSRTIWNDNSSRFGKFIKIEFDSVGNITGASIQTYLLEKSRIVRPPLHERNYHIFYRLLAGLSEADRKDLCLRDASHYHYLAQSRCFEIEDIDEPTQFQKTIEAMDIIGLSRDEQRNIFGVLAAVLNLGNVRFVGDEKASIENPGQIDIVAHLLGCKPKDLERALLTKELRTGSEVYTVYMDATKATGSRDTLAMLLYSRLFDWLVSKINQSLGRSDEGISFISILDIYGFECFEVNSFEQFCINYANEKLQQQFNHHIFKLEQEEYVREQIDWSYVQFKDNQECIDLIESRMGLLAILDEESKFPKATDESLLNKLIQSHARHINFKLPEFGEAAFSIVHYAGRVKYHTRGFLEKNRDYIVQEHMNLLTRSVDRPLISALGSFGSGSSQPGLFPPASPRGENRARSRSSIGGVAQGSSSVSSPRKGGDSSPSADKQNASTFAFLSVVAQFKDSLSSLMETISQTEPHYIRCVKPNDEKKPKLFARKKALHQLRSGGVLEAVRIASAGFPTRLPLEQFYQRYRMLMLSSPIPLKEILASASRMKTLCGKLFQEFGFGPERLQFGTTKLFLRAGVISQLEVLRLNKMNAAATKIQKHFRGMKFRKAFLRIRAATTRLCAIVRFIRDRAEARRRRELRAAIRLQKWLRRYVAQKKFRETMKRVIKLQQMARMVLARKKALELRRLRLANLVTSAVRGWKERGKFIRFRNAVIVAQNSFRVRRAKRELRRLRVEARSVDEVKKQRDAFQHQLQLAQDELGKTKEKLSELQRKSANDSELKELQSRLKQTQEEKESAEKSLRERSEREVTVRKSFEERIAQLEKELAEEKVKRSSDQSAHTAQLEQAQKSAEEAFRGKFESEKQNLVEKFEAERKSFETRIESEKRNFEEMTVSKLRAELSAKAKAELESVTSSLKGEQEAVTSSLRQQLEKATAEISQLRNEKALLESNRESLSTELEALKVQIRKLEEKEKKLEQEAAAQPSPLPPVPLATPQPKHVTPPMPVPLPASSSFTRDIPLATPQLKAEPTAPSLPLPAASSTPAVPLSTSTPPPFVPSSTQHQDQQQQQQQQIASLLKEIAKLRDEAAERSLSNDDLSELLSEKNSLVAEVAKLRKRITELEATQQPTMTSSHVTNTNTATGQPSILSRGSMTSSVVIGVSDSISATPSSSTVTMTSPSTAEIEARIRAQFETEIRDLKAELYDVIRARDRAVSTRSAPMVVLGDQVHSPVMTSSAREEGGGKIDLAAEIARRDSALTLAYEQNTLKAKQIESMQAALAQQRTEIEQLSSQIFSLSERLKSATAAAGGSGGSAIANREPSKLQQELIEQKKQVGLISRENTELRREKSVLQWEAEVRLKELAKELAKYRTAALLASSSSSSAESEKFSTRSLLRDDCQKLQELLFRSTAMCVKLTGGEKVRNQIPIATLFESAQSEGVHFTDYERWLNKKLLETKYYVFGE